jgi:hypothetical protein
VTLLICAGLSLAIALAWLVSILFWSGVLIPVVLALVFLALAGLAYYWSLAVVVVSRAKWDNLRAEPAATGVDSARPGGLFDVESQRIGPAAEDRGAAASP